MELKDLDIEINKLEEELKTLPKGYISKKIIRGKEAYYLQWREDNKIKSKYIPTSEIDEMAGMVALRQETEKKIRGLRQIKRLERYKDCIDFL